MNKGTENRDIITPEELAIAYAELQLGGHIEYFDNDERVRFTDTGLDEAFKLWFSFPPKDRLSLFLLIRLVMDANINLDEQTQ